ncbi:MAG: NUDIX hydrolase [Rhodobacteraceae bacterium]|nr:NUDIX hydrolase [Paracoccaceae bacterium]
MPKKNEKLLKEAKNKSKPVVHKQLAALCYRKGKSGTEVLLVTSSRGRWILPKGWPIDGKTNREAAMVEAWEEAGVKRGRITRKAVGSFVSTKTTRDGEIMPCELKVFAVEVSKIVTDYPEAEQRDRKWVSLSKAAKMVTEDGLRDILGEFRAA